jgi:hypothetical protein
MVFFFKKKKKKTKDKEKEKERKHTLLIETLSYRDNVNSFAFIKYFLQQREKGNLECPRLKGELIEVVDPHVLLVYKWCKTRVDTL